MSAVWARRGLGDPGDTLVPERTPGPVGNRLRKPTPDDSMRQNAVFSCVTLKSNLVESFDVAAYQQIGTEPVRRRKPPGLFRMVIDDWDFFDWVGSSQRDLELRGNTFARVLQRDSLQFPTLLQPLPVDSVRAEPYQGAWRWFVDNKPIDRQDLWQEKAYAVPGQAMGLSPIAYHAMTVGVVLAAQDFGADWFASGAHPSAVLTRKGVATVDQKTARIVKQKFLGAVRGREPLVMGGDWLYQPIQVKANESQFLDTMRYGGADIARIFHVPTDLLDLPGSGSSLTYANREQRNLDFLAMRIGPVLKRRERKWSRMLLPAGNWVRFDTSDLTRADTKTRYETAKMAIAGGWRTPTEVRADNGDEAFLPEQWTELFDLYRAQRVTVRVDETLMDSDPDAGEVDAP